ncbi:tRNA (adenosine(37)-N6)-threonylcarbamoyltransferase complex ATPase subunit type 1 TsaE [Kribbella sandramycini]|uniref:tRNA threonylcarbamoyladenosine biosynthesis protein TsaE n=1 Tax=Kribbella sandramycini TaxID=60450 RepID=A0A7Y4L0W0_9ACTN|nr:tRNA (adenosine(37)-N6)-threonylcarbamoyltransferase complex ATPase subunit type 1 TsaE [Kribbella sandramycini]MBB6564574.1 tRNA threonylcarbamoyladenosine biosynthesis protein TsaE [Kribbella sandramycini]NOL42278.1 tRNA (adenosine(37)-N6)-threonylcarbamoyltransferase complex ATPase subunit type 1 TsaE [Kribbella sandramycini]
MTDLHVVDATSEHVADIVAVIHHAFAARRVLDPPSTALSENAATVGAAVEKHGGLLVLIDGAPAGAVLFEVEGEVLNLRRVSVDPRHQARGVASAMVGCAEEVAVRRGLARVRLVARVELPDTVEFWRRRGYSVVERQDHNLIHAKAMPIERTVPTAEDMRAIAAELAGQLRAGDVLVLSGDLGAGKTTFTQGLGAGLKVRGDITSPTFVISRVHPSLVGGPALVHVDAYRLGGFAELDDLDLDASLDDAVTVVEWGHGLAEALAPDRLDVVVTRGDDDTDETRQLRITPVGPRWAASGVRVSVLEKN